MAAAEAVGEPVPYKGLFLQQMRVSDSGASDAGFISQWWVLRGDPLHRGVLEAARDRTFPTYDRAARWADDHLPDALAGA